MLFEGPFNALTRTSEGPGYPLLRTGVFPAMPPVAYIAGALAPERPFSQP